MAKSTPYFDSALTNIANESVNLSTVSWKLKDLVQPAMTVLLLIMIDIASLTAAMFIAFSIRLNILPTLSSRFTPGIPYTFYSHIWWIMAVLIFSIAYVGLYEKHMSFWLEARCLVIAASFTFILTLAVVTLGKLGGEFSRTILVLGYLLSLFLLPLGRYIGKMGLSKINMWNVPLLILRAGSVGKTIAHSYIYHPYMGYRVCGFMEDDPLKKKQSVIINGVNYRILGGFADAVRVITQNSINNVIIAAPGLPGPELVALTNKLKAYTHSVMVVPDLLGIPINNVEITHLFDERIMAYSTRNNLARPFNIFFKRFFDIFVGTIIFILLIPVLALIALAIKLESPGPVGFSHYRIGKGNQGFNCYKFRSMVPNAQEMLEELFAKNPKLREEWEQDFKLKNDPRVTKVGRFLRKTSLDELPQIFNVIKGEMSLVGPRPIVRDELAKFGENARDYLMVLPGMTGLWGVSGRSDIDYDERVQMETWYIRNWSLWLDISLLFRTVGVVFGKKGAY